MRVVYWAVILLAAAVLSLFAASNRETVSLGLWPLPFLAQAPLYLVILVSLLFGIAIGALFAWIRGRHRRGQLRECRRQNQALARELAATQAQLASDVNQARPALPQNR